MKNFDSYTDQLRRHCGENELEVVIRDLCSLLEEIEGNYYKAAVNCSRRMRELRRLELLGTCDFEMSSREQNKICQSLWDLLDELEGDKAFVSWFERGRINVRLETSDPRAQPKQYILSGETHLGRGYNCEVRIDEERVSRKHARMYFSEGECWIEDLKSMNKTFVNQIEIRKAALQDGDVIHLFEVPFTVHIHKGSYEEFILNHA